MGALTGIFPNYMPGKELLQSRFDDAHHIAAALGAPVVTEEDMIFQTVVERGGHDWLAIRLPTEPASSSSLCFLVQPHFPSRPHLLHQNEPVDDKTSLVIFPGLVRRLSDI